MVQAADKIVTPPVRRSKRAAVKRHVKARYDRHMPDKKHHRVLIWMVFFVCSAIIAGQLLYPPDRALPFTRIAGQDVVWQDHDHLAELLVSQFSNTKLKLAAAGEDTTELSLASAGADLNTERMIDRVIDYPFWQRFVPLSVLFQSDIITDADVFYTDSVLKKASGQQAKQLSFDPVNARLAIEDGQLVATAEKAGSKVTAEAVYETISTADILLGTTTTLIIPAESVAPAETSSSLRSVQAAAEAALARTVQITAGDQTFTPDKAIIASWLQLATDEAGRPTLKVSTDKLNNFFDTIDSKVAVPAGQTNINLTNGRETSRTTGSVGKAISRDELRTAVSKWLLSGQGSGIFAATFRDVQPSIIYDNKYTATEEGLRAYVLDASKRMDVRIAIQQLDGGRWTASARADESIPSASTYKLFVAKWLFDEMDKGNISWGDPILDTNVSVCFDRMTIASTNPCAESWLAQAGRANFNNYIWGLGFSRGTNFNMPVATHTTANDLQKMMLSINDGSLMSGANRERLYHSLGTHPYRYGIPTGSGGRVYDKVGFLWDYVHDTAIVRHPRGTYVMTIMTKGQSYGTIAALTREIERIMYP